MRQCAQQVLFGGLPQTQRLFRERRLRSDAGLVLSLKGLLELGEGLGISSLSAKGNPPADGRFHIVAEERVGRAAENPSN
jgi:hypothetical protein